MFVRDHTERIPEMREVTYLVNRREPDAAPLADQMRTAGVDFCSVPTSGPLTLWVDGRASYGPMAVRRAVRLLIRTLKSHGHAGAV